MKNSKRISTIFIFICLVLAIVAAFNLSLAAGNPTTPAPDLTITPTVPITHALQFYNDTVIETRKEYFDYLETNCAHGCEQWQWDELEQIRLKHNGFAGLFNNNMPWYLETYDEYPPGVEVLHHDLISKLPINGLLIKTPAAQDTFTKEYESPSNQAKLKTLHFGFWFWAFASQIWANHKWLLIGSCCTTGLVFVGIMLGVGKALGG